MYKWLLLMTAILLAPTAFADDLVLKSQTQTHTATQLHYSINIQYPELVLEENKSNKHYSPETLKGLNQLIHLTAVDIQREFIENISTDINPERPLAANNVDANRLIVSYQRMATNADVMSLRFTIESNYYLAAHPSQSYRSLNVDLKNNKLLTLEDMFTSADYLKEISDYCSAELEKTLATTPGIAPDLAMIKQGTKPILQNFNHWNITDKGILFTFPPAQVAPSVYGTQECLKKTAN